MATITEGDAHGVHYNGSFNYTTTLYMDGDSRDHEPALTSADYARFLFSEPHRVVAMVLGVLAISLNILSILAILKARSKLSSHYRFIVSLALSDIWIGVTVTAHIVNRVVNYRGAPRVGTWQERLVRHCAYVIIKALNTTSLNITLLNLMAMALDHYLAILRPLHYPSMMNESRATSLIVIFWIIALICGFSDFLSVYPHRKHLGKYNYCELVAETPYQDEYPLFCIALGCFTIMTFTYIRMFMAIKQRHTTVGPVQNETRNQKALYTTLFILGTFILCWLPQCIFQISLIIAVQVNRNVLAKVVMALYKADQYLTDLLLLNAILDPLIYAIRMKEVQIGYRRLFTVCRVRAQNGRNGHYSMTEASHSTVLLDEKRSVTSLAMGSIRGGERQTNGRKMLITPSVRVHHCE